MQTTFSMMQDMGTFVYTNKIGPSRKNSLEMGGRAQGPAQARGACPPFLEQKRFQNISPFFSERTNIPYLSLLKPRAKSESFSQIV